MTLIMIFVIEDELGSSLLFQKWILEARIIWKSGITLLPRHISSKVIFSSVLDMLIYANYAAVATKLNFLQFTCRVRINHKTVYSQTFPGHI